VIRKSKFLPGNNKKIIFFRVDGGKSNEIGTGHVIRSITLASKLNKNFRPIFLSNESDLYSYGHDQIRKFKFELVLLSENSWVKSFVENIKKFQPSFLVIDLYQYNNSDLSQIRKNSRAKIMTFDHFKPHNYLSDFPINAIITKTENNYEGLKYMVLPKMESNRFAQKVSNVFVSFGGFDYLNLTKKFLKAFIKFQDRIIFNIVVSEIYKSDLIFKQIKPYKNVRLHVQPREFNKLLTNSDLAIISGGLTMFQAISSRVPSIVISQYEHQDITAKDFHEYGAYLYLGRGENVAQETLEISMSTLINDSAKRYCLHKNSQELIDGKGAERCLELIESNS